MTERPGGWGRWLAIAGLIGVGALLALMLVAVAALGALYGGSGPSFTALALPLLVLGGVVALLAVGLARWSRVAWVVTMLVVMLLMGAALTEAISSGPGSIVFLLAAPCLLVAAGLLVARRGFWMPVVRIPGDADSRTGQE